MPPRGCSIPAIYPLATKTKSLPEDLRLGAWSFALFAMPSLMRLWGKLYMRQIRRIPPLAVLLLLLGQAPADDQHTKTKSKSDSKQTTEDWLTNVEEARDKAVRLVAEVKALSPNNADLQVLENRYNDVRNTYVLSASQAGSILRKQAEAADPLILATAEQAKRTMVQLRNWVNAYESRIKQPHDPEAFAATVKHKSRLQVIAKWLWDNRDALVKIVTDLRKAHAENVVTNDSANEQLAKRADEAAKWPEFKEINPAPR